MSDRESIIEELQWLQENASVAGLRLDGRAMSFDEAMCLYAPTLHRMAFAPVPQHETSVPDPDADG